MKRLFKFITASILLIGIVSPANIANAGKKEDPRDREVQLAKKIIPKDQSKRCPRYEDRIKEIGLPVQVFSYIMWRESRCQPKAIGWNYKNGFNYKSCKLAPANEYKKCKAISSYDSGLFQINSSWITVTSKVCKSEWGDMTVLLQEKCNLKVAKYLFYQGGGLGNWGFRVNKLKN